jgi:hypothetical protein
MKNFARERRESNEKAEILIAFPFRVFRIFRGQIFLKFAAVSANLLLTEKQNAI